MKELLSNVGSGGGAPAAVGAAPAAGGGGAAAAEAAPAEEKKEETKEESDDDMVSYFGLGVTKRSFANSAALVHRALVSSINCFSSFSHHHTVCCCSIVSLISVLAKSKRR